MHWQSPVRVRCLHFVDSAGDNSLLDVNFKGLPIEIAPLQAYEFARPQAEARRHNTHCLNWFLQLVKQPTEFLDRQNPWLPETFRGTFDPDEAHGIHSIYIDKLPLHRPVEQDMHN